MEDLNCSISNAKRQVASDDLDTNSNLLQDAAGSGGCGAPLHLRQWCAGREHNLSAGADPQWSPSQRLSSRYNLTTRLLCTCLTRIFVLKYNARRSDCNSKSKIPSIIFGLSLTILKLCPCLPSVGTPLWPK